MDNRGILANQREWNDAASEEYFAKLFNFATVRSRNFRVRSLPANTSIRVPRTLIAGAVPRVIATANKVYEVFSKQTRDVNGNITGQNFVVTYEGDVP